MSIFLIFVANGFSYLIADKSLPFSAEAIAGIVAITTAAVGISTAGNYFSYRSYSSAAQYAGQPIVPPTGMVGPPGGG